MLAEEFNRHRKGRPDYMFDLYTCIKNLNKKKKKKKVLKIGPLSLSKCDLYLNLYNAFPAEKVSFHKDDLFDGKDLANVTFIS